MRKYCRRKNSQIKSIHFVFLLMFICCNSCDEPLKEEIIFYDDINFNSGDYKILVYGVEGEIIDDYRDFYIEDTTTLNKMKKQWIFTKKSEVMPCGFGYIIYLVDQKNVVKETSVNIECEYMSGWIRFPKSYLSNHKKSFIKMKEIEKTNFSEQYFKK